MGDNTPYDGPIDPWSPYDLHDVVNDEVEAPDPEDPTGPIGTEYRGLHIIKQSGRGTYHVQPEGHAGTVDSFTAEEIDGVLELVDRLNGLAEHWGVLQDHADKEELVEWAGKIMTSDEQRANERPDIYLKVPDRGEA